jgi:type VI protein secretion system component VasK
MTKEKSELAFKLSLAIAVISFNILLGLVGWLCVDKLSGIKEDGAETKSDVAALRAEVKELDARQRETNKTLIEFKSGSRWTGEQHGEYATIKQREDDSRYYELKGEIKQCCAK